MAEQDPVADGLGRKKTTRSQHHPTSAVPAASSGDAKVPFHYVPSPSPIDPFIVATKQFDFATSTLSQIGTGALGGSNIQVTTSRLPTSYNAHTGPIRSVSHPHSVSHPDHVPAPASAASLAPQTTTAVGDSSTRPQSATQRQTQQHGPQPHVHRGSSNVQYTFFEKLNSQQFTSYARKKTVDDEAAAALRQQQAVANNVADRLVEMQAHRQAVQRRIRPSSAASSHGAYHTEAADSSNIGAARGLQISREAGTSNRSPSARNQPFGEPSSNGFDSRIAVLRAARSACLQVAPQVTSPSARKTFYDVETASRPSDHHSAPEPTDEASLMLRHRRTELMLASNEETAEIPLVGAGMRALLLASEDDVHRVASGVLVLAQVLGEDIQAHQQTNAVGGTRGLASATAGVSSGSEHLVPTAAPFYKDTRNQGGGSGGGESWRIVFAGHQSPQRGGMSPLRNQSPLVGKIYALFSHDEAPPVDLSADGSSLMPHGEVLNGSAVRIRGRPHTAPLSRARGDTSSTKSIDYLAQLRSERPSSAAKKRPSSALPHNTDRQPRPYSAASTGSRSTYVLDPQRDPSTRPRAPEWLDSRGLIGVSVDPRYQAGEAQSRDGFDFFVGNGVSNGVSDDAERVPCKHHESRFTHFRSGTTLSTQIREARVKRDATATAQRRGILRGGAGFLMFSTPSGQR